MTISIICSQTAAKQIGKLDRSTEKKIIGAVTDLSRGYPVEIGSIPKMAKYVLKVGGYRVFFDIQVGKLRVLLIKNREIHKIYAE
jgi:mRNA-degrading endonuclease RelE of RelBE toxin-antitoxin system